MDGGQDAAAGDAVITGGPVRIGSIFPEGVHDLSWEEGHLLTINRHLNGTFISSGEHEAMHILVVEDEMRLVALLRRSLAEEGHAVDFVTNGEDALTWLDTGNGFDAVILDVMLPGIDGFDTCRRLRSSGIQVPILMLTARDAVPERVTGLDAGADDYLVKPFAFAELAARLRALVRRPADTADTVLAVADIRLDPARRQVWRASPKSTSQTRSSRSSNISCATPTGC